MAAAYDPQLEWIAAINGMTPQQYLDAQARAQAVERGADPTQASAAIRGAIWDAGAAEDAYVQGLGTRAGAYQQQLGGLSSQLSGLGGSSMQRALDLRNTNAGLGAQSAASAASANSMMTQGLADFRAAAAAPTIMRSSGYVGDAVSNPADLQRQMAAYNQLAGISNGSLDIQSQAARAYANAGDIANQQAAAAQLRASGNGALNVNLQSIRELDKLRDPTQIEGMRDLRDIYAGKLDVKPGDLDPEAYAAAVDARNQLKGLTTPTVTAAERLMYEMSRQQQEQDESAVRAALDSQAQRRGSYSSGSSIARSALGAQQTSKNRMLQDMQANAMAQQRAMQALQGYGTLSTNMTAQANTLAAQNQATRAGAMNQYSGIGAAAAQTLGQIGAANATANANRQLAAQQAASQAYAELRAQGFSEEYARGKAADIVAQGNQQVRLSGAQSQGTMASEMRRAGDAMSTFNQAQRQQQGQFNDTFQASREDAVFNRQRNVFDATNITASGNDQRTQGSIGVQQGLNNDWMNAAQNADNTTIAAAGVNRGIYQDQFNAGQLPEQAKVTLGRQKVADNTTIRDLGVSDQSNARQLGAIIGPQGPGADPPGYTQPGVPAGTAPGEQIDEWGFPVRRA